MTNAILAPAAALVAWTLVMLLWMAAARGPALRKIGVDKLKPGARGQDLEDVFDAPTAWKGHNYNHLHEQPTLFYAVVLILALTGFAAADVVLAWAYVALRIAHSIWQATANRQPVRVILFVTSSLLLMALSVRALIGTL